MYPTPTCVADMAKLIHLAAVARNRVIGNNNELCWNIPEDLRHFKNLTMGHSVIMGRKTWDSLPAGLKPLPGRRNIVVTRQPGFLAAGAEVVGTLEAAQALVAAEDMAFIMGGAELYAQSLSKADVLLLTEIDLAPEGDVFYPTLGPEWVEHSREAHRSNQGVAYDFVAYRRAG